MSEWLENFLIYLYKYTPEKITWHWNISHLQMYMSPIKNADFPASYVISKGCTFVWPASIVVWWRQELVCLAQLNLCSADQLVQRFRTEDGVSNKQWRKPHGKPIERLQLCSGVPKIQSFPRIILSTSKDFNHATSTWCTWWSLIFSINFSGSSFITAVTLSILECLPFIVRRNPRFPHWFVVVRGTPKASLKRAQKRR